MKQAVFFDRDGVINELVYNPEQGTVDSLLTPDQVSLVYGISELITEVKKLDFITITCSNQPSVALGKISLQNFKQTNEKIKLLLKQKGESIDYEYFCMHHPYAKLKEYKKECDCKKPKPGLLLKAAKEHSIDLSKSWMIGDGVGDIIAGKKAGCKTILLANIESAENLRIIEKQLGDINPDFIIKKLPQAVEIIKNSL